MKEKILALAKKLDSIYKIQFSEQGKINLFKSEYFQGAWRYQHCCDIKAEWMNFQGREKNYCEWFDFKAALQVLADQTNSFE
jgi:hypothetical protein